MSQIQKLKQDGQKNLGSFGTGLMKMHCILERRPSDCVRVSSGSSHSNTTVRWFGRRHHQIDLSHFLIRMARSTNSRKCTMSRIGAVQLYANGEFRRRGRFLEFSVALIAVSLVSAAGVLLAE